MGKLTNTKALQLFHLLRQSSLILTAVLLTKYSLALEDIGAYEMLLYLGYILSFWWVSGLVQGLLTRHPQLHPIEQKQLIFNAYLLFLALSLGLFVLLFFFKSFVLQILVGQNEVRYFQIFMLYALLNFPVYLLENILLLQEKPKEILWYGIFSFLVQPALVLLPIYAGWDFYWSIWGLTVAAGLKHLWLLINIIQNSIWKIRIDFIKNWIFTALPLILYALLGGFNTAFDNWLVNYHYKGDEAIFAIFRYGAQELPITIALTNALGTAMLPEVQKDLKGALEAIKHKSRRLFHVLFPLTIGLIFAGKWLFPWVFNEAFIASVDIFNIYLLIIISRIIFSRSILIGLQANKEILIISIIELVINALASFILVQYLGLIGIALGTLIAYTLEKIMLCAYLYVRFRIPVQAYTDLRWLAGYVSILLICYYLSTF